MQKSSKQEIFKARGCLNRGQPLATKRRLRLGTQTKTLSGEGAGENERKGDNPNYAAAQPVNIENITDSNGECKIYSLRSYYSKNVIVFSMLAFILSLLFSIRETASKVFPTPSEDFIEL